MSRDSQPRILYLVHRVPYPPNRGDRIRSYHLLAYLAARAQVYLATLADEPVSPETHETLQRLCARVAVLPVGPRSRWFGALCSFAAGRSMTEGLFHSSALWRTIEEWASSTRFDAVVVFCSSMGPYLNAPGLGGVPVFTDFVDVDSQKWADYAQRTSGLRRWIFQHERKRVQNLERSVAAKSHRVTVVSEPEAELLAAVCPHAPVEPIANGVDVDYFTPAPEPEPAAPRMAFVGALDYRANIDGATWFGREVWPLVRKRLPDCKWTLVGRSPASDVRRLESIDGIEVAGTVPDVRPYLREALFTIAPLRVARGIQNKVLESLAAGRTVIASPDALEGLDLQPGTHVLKASNPVEWVESIVTLWDDPLLRRRLAAAGRAFVETHHRWDACLSRWGEWLELSERSPGEFAQVQA
jgi:sugar transferase (PEP-CTERM/EpsH1 system associated)